MAEKLYTGNTGLKSILAANPNLDGTGTTYMVITGQVRGTHIKSLTIKATGTTTQNTVRLFIYDGANKYSLFAELSVDAITPSGTDTAFEKVLYLDLFLKAGYQIKASTNNAEVYTVIAEGLDWDYDDRGTCCDTTKYDSNTSIEQIGHANPNRDGTGTLVTVLTAGGNGCSIISITIKGLQTVTDGMIRLFIQNAGSTSTLLWMEIPVTAVTQSATQQSFVHQIHFQTSFSLEAGYKILATTENAEAFSIMIDANDWSY